MAPPRHVLVLLMALTFMSAVNGALEEWSDGDGCTSIIVSDGATLEGGTMTTHTDDCLDCDFRVSRVPAADHDAGAVRPVYGFRSSYPRFLGYGRGATYEPENTDLTLHPWKVGEGDFAVIGSIPEVAHTHSYIDGGYGIMNEYQVAIGESTCGAALTALPVHKGGKALLEAGELSRIALERCATARCAVLTMGGLAVAHGFYGADATPGEGGEALQVVDPAEAWVFHVTADDSGASAVWAAQRVPRGHVAAVANQFIIRTVKEGHEDFLSSGNLAEVAARAGLLDAAAAAASAKGAQEEGVDFTAVFGVDRGHLSPYCNRRRWRVMDLAAPSLGLPAEGVSSLADEYPFSVPVDAKLTVADLLAMNRDHYEGTPYDMTQGLAAGPYGDPSRFDPGSTRHLYAQEQQQRGQQGRASSGGLVTLRGGGGGGGGGGSGSGDDGGDASVLAVDDGTAWSGLFERAISMYRCAYSWVSQSRPHVDRRLGTVWFGPYAPHASGATPLYAGANVALPPALTTGALAKFDLESSYWIHAVIGNWADRFYVHTIGDIKQQQQELETASFLAQPALAAAVEVLARRGQSQGDGEAKVVAALSEASLQASKVQMAAWTDFLFTLLARFKDGQRIDDVHAYSIKPTKLFYPKWWLDAVGFFTDGGEDDQEDTSGEEKAVAVPTAVSAEGYIGADGLASLLTHLLAAAAAAAATLLYTQQRRDGDCARRSGARRLGVELTSAGAAQAAQPAVFRHTYQQVP